MKHVNVIWVLAMVFALGQTYIIFVQGSTIRSQQKTIRQMVQNHNCLIP